jgi:hypothetical protein
MNNQKNNTELDKSGVTHRLFLIRNIAALAAHFPEEKAEVYLLQNVVNHIADMVADLIEDIGA